MIKIRSRALDVFRGLTVALMILVNNPGSWAFVHQPFLHAPWHGLTPTDLVFPFFLFAVGNALFLVKPNLKKSLKRTTLVFLIGLGLNWAPIFTWVGEDLVFKCWTWVTAEGIEVGLRVMGVLQRIALAYGFASLLCLGFKRHILAVSLLILLCYWALCVWLGSGDVYGIEGWFGTSVDRAIFGPVHLYQGEGVAFDPEGLMSTIPSVSQVMLGYWAGEKLKTFGPEKILKNFSGIGLLMIFFGVIWHFVHPINKKIWTGSYVLVTTGLALILLGFLVEVLDVKKRKTNWAWFFEAFGKNPLFIFVLSVLIPKTLGLLRIPTGEKFLTPLQWFYENVCAYFPGQAENGSLVYAVILVGFYGWLAWWMDRKKIYVRV